jgi:putative DNA primase/helicase
VVSDSIIDAWIYRDIVTLMGQQFVDTLKVTMIGDVRKFLKMDLDSAKTIPDAHWRMPDGENRREGKDYITVSNGILDVERGKLENHTSDWFSFHSLPMNYDEDAKCPNFLAFLNDIWDGDDELIESLRLWMGYCLLTSCAFEKFAVFKGASRAGKSTLAAVIESIVGKDNTVSTSLSLIGSDFGLQNLMGKKLCVFQDAERASPDRMGIATERIKSLSSNEPIGINRKGQAVLVQRLGLKIAFVCNRLPNFLNDENALTNRMVVFPFWKSFAGREDSGLKERLMGEIGGVFNWALVGARRLLRGEKLFTSKRGLEEMELIAQQLDSVEGFIAECIEVTGMEHNVVTNDDLWRAYKEWCKDSNRSSKNRQWFLINIRAHKKMAGTPWRNNTVRGFYKVRLKAPDGIFDDDVPF